MSVMNKVVVIGTSHHNTLGMIRCLGQAGYLVDLILIDQANSYITHSRYLSKVVVLSGLSELIKCLSSNYDNQSICPIIISCSDAVASYLDSNYDEIKDKYYFFNSGNANKVTACMDKQYQVALAKEFGLNTPHSYIFKGDISKTIYPCLLKPVQSINGGKQVMICHNDNELLKSLTLYGKSVEVLVQQYLKKEYEVVILGLSVNGQIFIPGYILKHRDYDGGTLYSTVKSISSFPKKIIQSCKDMIQAMDYEGLFGVELIYSNNNYYFIECNLRNDATTYALAVAGVNLPELYVKVKRENFVLPISCPVKEIKSIVEFNDFKHRKNFGVSLYQWLKEYLRASCKYYFNWKDPMPFFYAPFK